MTWLKALGGLLSMVSGLIPTIITWLFGSKSKEVDILKEEIEYANTAEYIKAMPRRTFSAVLARLRSKVRDK